LDDSTSTKTTLASGQRVSSSFQVYQSAFGLPRDERDSTNHGCWSLVWFMTRSAMTRIWRRCASSRNAARSSEVPRSGWTVKKSLMS